MSNDGAGMAGEQPPWSRNGGIRVDGDGDGDGEYEGYASNGPRTPLNLPKAPRKLGRKPPIKVRGPAQLSRSIVQGRECLLGALLSNSFAINSVRYFGFVVVDCFVSALHGKEHWSRMISRQECRSHSQAREAQERARDRRI